MRSITASFVFILIVATMSSASGKDKEHYDIGNAHSYFEQFIKDNNRQYKDDADKEVHFRAFVDNLKKINKLNDEQPTATFGINKFADYTEEERQNMFGLRHNK